jgi:microcystin-dependent protein
MGFTRDWSAAGARILDHLKFKSAPGEIRSVMVDLEDRLASILYGFTAGETIPGIKKGRFIKIGTGVQTTPPGTGAATSLDVYSRADGTGSAVELYALDALGNETKLTAGGKIPNASLENPLLTVLAAVYPVGSIYATTSATDPATVFGFGTWAAYGAGRVMVGKAAAGTFATAGGTGGAETITLTAAQSGLPAHVHPCSVGSGYSESISRITNTNDSEKGTVNTGQNSAAAASEAHNNLQPYIITYLFQRTA